MKFQIVSNLSGVKITSERIILLLLLTAAIGQYYNYRDMRSRYFDVLKENLVQRSACTFQTGIDQTSNDINKLPVKFAPQKQDGILNLFSIIFD